MARSALDDQIAKLREEVLLLGSMVEQATFAAVDSLKNRDTEAAREVYLRDEAINQKRFDIENACLITIATQQPLAHDLRILAAILEVSTELERMGDYSKGIAHITFLNAGAPHVKPLIDIPRMAELCVDMLHRALEMFVSEDAEGARKLPDEDDAVDALYNQVHRELLDIMIEDPSTVDGANYLSWAAHNLERMADRVTNICERTIFVASGEIIELDHKEVPQAL